MSVYRALNAMTAMAVIVASLLIFSGHAYAHERRTLGPYEVEVGWLNEPAYLGQLNSIDLHVTDTRNDQPVAGLEKTLTAEVAAGGLSPYTLSLSAQFDTAGAYEGSIMPTVAGSYTFHLKGKIGTLDVDEKFTSGPNTFGDVEDISVVQYPAKVPAADGLSKKLDAIQSAIDQTRIIAIAALALAVIGLGGVALARRRT
jgi:hypothetical protein